MTVLDRTDAVVARAGPSLHPTDDALTVTAVVGDPDRPAGKVVLTRPTAPLDDQVHKLWTLLATAAALALVVGAVVGWALGRWIATPLRSLTRAAQTIGAGSPLARADATVGPEQVRAVAAAFNEMADRVAALLAAQTAMTADVSHQLRTPLAALRLRLDLLTDEVSGDARGEVFGMIAETSRLSRLVDGLLAVARADAEVAAPEPIDVGAVCRERVAAWDPIAAERGVYLSVDENAQGLARITPGHLEQILDNLLANALDALPPDGTVRLEVDTVAATTSVRVIDDGPGMSAELRTRAFDRFVSDRHAAGGTGLGLAIVGRLVAGDHGTAELSETRGGGLTVDVRLPATTR